ncbi:MAG: clostripain-related cysteine peptidase [Candidatus Bathyarchaeia archaeon]
MKIKQLVLLCIVILAVGQYAPLALASKNPKASWAFMVYLDADNNLDEYGQINLEQMKEGLAPNAAINVIVLMDRLNLPAYIYEVTHEEIKTVQALGEVDMGSQQTLSYFVTFAMKKYPANYFFLDLWDHGGGYRGVCWDESSGNHLSPHDVEMAVASAENQTKKFVHVVGFDACLMGMIEICYELKDVTNIVIGSEMLIPGLGWPYTQIMAYLSNNPQTDPAAFSTYLVNEYVTSYPKYTVQLSAIDEESIPEMATSLNNFADALMTNIDLYRGVIAGARSDAQQKFILGTWGSYFYIDLYKFAMLIGERVGDENIAELAGL